MASMVQCVLISGLVLLTFHFATSDSNPCSNYKSINQAKRSPEHILARGEKAICDNKLVPGWYRFTNAEQAQIPTTKPGIHHCGTLAPIWIQGKHPMKTGEEVEAIACANINNRIKGCMYSRHVRVKNCGNYYVYHLQPTEGRCMAYCAGKQPDVENIKERKIRSISANNCAFKNDSCSINGKCYTAKEANPTNWCQQCIPQTRNDSWTSREDNISPSFEKGSIRKAIVGENLPIQLKAIDPDGRPITYSLISSTTSSGYKFSSTGLLQWNVTSQANFTVQVTDECNATDTITITVQIMKCPCKNGGQCSPLPNFPRGSGQYSCQCPKGFSGDNCDTNVDDCVSVNCGNGTCIDGINNYTCRCNLGFTGSMCRIDKCTNQSCFTGVQCTDTARGMTCGPCPIGLSGDGKICKAMDSSTTTVPSTTRKAFTTQAAPMTTEAPTATTTVIPTTTPTTLALQTTTAPLTTTATPTTTEAPTTTAPTTAEPTTVQQVETTTAQQVETTTADILMTTTQQKSTESPATTTVILETLSPELPTPTNVYALRAEITIKLTWNEDYSDKTSDAFKKLVLLLEEQISKAFHGDPNFQKVTVIVFREGSVIADFELAFKNKTANPLRPLKSAIRNGTLGDLEVIPKSLIIKEENNIETKTEPKNKSNIVLIVVLVIIAALIIVMVAVTFYIHNRNRKRKMDISKGQSEDGTPGETLPLTEQNTK